jgi:hypothetical protein
MGKRRVPPSKAKGTEGIHQKPKRLIPKSTIFAEEATLLVTRMATKKAINTSK